MRGAQRQPRAARRLEAAGSTDSAAAETGALLPCQASPWSCIPCSESGVRIAERGAAYVPNILTGRTRVIYVIGLCSAHFRLISVLVNGTTE